MYKNGPRAPFKPPRPLLLESKVPDQANRVVARPKVAEKTDVPSSVIEKINKRSDQVKPLHDSNKRLKVEQINTSSASSYIVQWRKKSSKKNKTWDGDGIINYDGSTITFKCDTKGNDKFKTMGSITRKSIEGLISIGSYELEVDCEVDAKENIEHKPIGASKPLPKASLFKKVIPTVNSVTAITSRRAPLNDPSDTNSLVMKRPTEDSLDVVVDPKLCAALRPHQRDGVAFLYECVMGLRDFKGNGALLADEMGLGKTLMTITLIYTLLKQSPYDVENQVVRGAVCKKVLIACPVTLIGNWKKEFKKWLGIHKVSVLAINNKQSSAKDKQDIRNFGKTRVYNVMILSYEKVLSCQDELKDLKVDLLVCDEGHRLKNSANKVAKVFNESLNIKKRVLLTGTPMQNDLTEFFNICNFINPGVLGTFSSFQKEYLKPILRLREVNCINKETIKRGEMKSRELVELTKHFTLRRTSDILSKYLPAKTDLILFCPPTSQQRSLFNFVSSSQKFRRLILQSSSNDSLLMINLFKKICNSPILLQQDKTFQALKNEVSGKVDSSLDKSSGKILALIPLLIEIRKTNEKTVIISNYTQTLDLLEEILRKLNLQFLRLDGTTPNTMRDKLVVEFNTLPISANSVFLLSAKSGGVGLNLIGASRLVLFDNDWNPSVDLQAMARIHRDGQKKNVYIYRLLTTGCMDEKIFQRQLMKNSLSDKFVDNKNDSNSDVFDIEDLKDLFTVVKETKSNTHDLLECECSGIGEDLLLESQEEENEVKEESDDDAPPGWISALDYKQVDQKSIKKKATIRNALLEYNHYDPKNYTEEGLDSVLTNVIKNSKDCPISYLLSKYTTNKIEE